MNKRNKKNILKISFALLFAVVGVSVLSPVKVFAVDTDQAYQRYSLKLGSCPRVGQPAREECQLKVMVTFLDTYCKNKGDRATCNNEWDKGFLTWFAKQPNQDLMRNRIGLTLTNTSDPACKDRTGTLPSYCTDPYNKADCAAIKNKEKPDYCTVPALSTDSSNTSGSTPEASPECSKKENADKEECNIKVECDKGDISAKNCGITRYLNMLINLLSGLVGITVVGVLIIGGIQYSTSAGDPQAAAAARKRISNAVLALVAFGMMYGFLQWIVPGGVL